MKRIKLVTAVLVMAVFTAFILSVPMIYYLGFDNELLDNENISDLNISYQHIELSPQKVYEIVNSNNVITTYIDSNFISDTDIYSLIERSFDDLFTDYYAYSEIAYAARSLISDKANNFMNYGVSTVMGKLDDDIFSSVSLADIEIYNDKKDCDMQLRINYTSNQVYSIYIENADVVLIGYDEYYNGLSEEIQKKIPKDDKSAIMSLWYERLVEYWQTDVNCVDINIFSNVMSLTFLQEYSISEKYLTDGMINEAEGYVPNLMDMGNEYW